MDIFPHDRSTKTTHTAGSLERALTHLSGCLCLRGSNQEEWDKHEVEWQLLREWCQAEGLVLPLDFPPPVAEGGREHDVRFAPANEDRPAYWWKYTKANSAGYTVEWGVDSTPYMLNASPSQYLQRLQWQNQLLADEITLVGIWESSTKNWHIVTTQPDVPFPYPEALQIPALMQRIEASQLPWKGVGHDESLAYALDGFALWDVRSHNMKMDADGWPYLFDVILTKLP